MSNLNHAMVASALLLCSEAGAQPATPEMFGALPNVSEVEISPDGKTIAQIQSDADLRAVAFYDLAGEAKPTGVKLGSVKARDLVWASPDYALLLVSASHTDSWGEGLRTFEAWRWISIDRRTGKTAILFKGSKRGWWSSGSGRLLATLPAEPDQVLMSRYGALYKVSLANASDTVVHNGETMRWGEYWTEDWVVDASGEALVRIDYDARREQRRFFVRREGTDRFEPAAAVPEKMEDDTLIVDATPAESKTVIDGLMNETGMRSLCAYDVVAGARLRCDLSATGYDLSEPIVDRVSRRAVGARFTDDLPRTRFIDADLAAVEKGLAKALASGAPQVTSWSDDRARFIVRVDYPDHPAQFFLYDRPSKKLDLIASAYPALDGKTVASKERYDYITTDGLKIPGYLTLPKGAVRRSMPLIVMPHGGPQARDDMSFDWWAFFYASRGYLVYQPNFRGSDGYGLSFRKAGYQQWGRKMQDDITEGVGKLIAEGVVDSDRVCIVGASYGGYAALAGATLTPDLYACAISVAGVSNVPSYLYCVSDGGEYREDTLQVQVGARVSDNDELQAVSPYYQAARARAPILLIHGKDDTIVPIGQSRGMRDALVAARKQVEFVELSGEDHWLSSAATRTEMLRASIAFIDKHIGAEAQ